MHYEAPPAERVEKEVDAFLAWFNTSSADANSPYSDGLVRAGIAHLWFETLHPFEDGNGRVGRAIIDMALAQDIRQGTRLFGISRRMANARDEYYRELERAKKGDLDITEWLCWFISQFRFACEQSARILDRSLEKAKFWGMHAGNSLTDAQRKVVNVLLDAGPQGFDGGMSTRKYCSLTKVSPATASRDLGALAKLGVFVVTGKGKSTRYWINMPDWAPSE